MKPKLIATLEEDKPAILDEHSTSQPQTQSL